MEEGISDLVLILKVTVSIRRPRIQFKSNECERFNSNQPSFQLSGMKQSPDKLSILYSTPAYKPAYEYGGPIAVVESIATRLVARGHRVAVYTTDFGLQEHPEIPRNAPQLVDGVEVRYFERKNIMQGLFRRMSYFSKSMGYFFAPRLGNVVRHTIGDFDVVHTHMPYVYPTHAVARMGLKAQRPLFYHQHGVFDPARLRFRNLKKKLSINLFDRRIMRQAAMLFALTEAERRSYRSLGVEAPCRVIPNGIDTDVYLQHPNTGCEPLSGIPSDHIVILYLSRLHPIKGADILFESFLRIARQFRRATLVIAGPDEWGLESTFRQRVAATGLNGQVKVAGLVTGRQKLELLARADLFCLPSLAEGFSVAVLEALASATPVMITPGCNFPEVELHGAGWVVERDAEKWATALAEVIADPESLAVAGHAGLQLVRRNYTWDRIVDQIESTYIEVLDRRKRLAHT